MTIADLPALNAILNFVSATLLAFGYAAVKRQAVGRHKRFMIAALISSGLFLTSYAIYHAHAGSVPYLRYDWTRPVYFGILIPHVVLAGVMAPFIVMAVWYALRGDFVKHTRITRRLWPVWMFVSVSGVIIYFMLYHL